MQAAGATSEAKQASFLIPLSQSASKKLTEFHVAHVFHTVCLLIQSIGKLVQHFPSFFSEARRS